VRAWLDKFRPSGSSVVIKAEVTGADGKITTIPLNPVDQQLDDKAMKTVAQQDVYMGPAGFARRPRRESPCRWPMCW